MTPAPYWTGSAAELRAAADRIEAGARDIEAADDDPHDHYLACAIAQARRTVAADYRREADLIEDSR